MKTYSFIDSGNRDFVKDSEGETIRKKFESKDHAESWILSNQHKTDWSNTGVCFYCWEDEE